MAVFSTPASHNPPPDPTPQPQSGNSSFGFNPDLFPAGHDFANALASVSPEGQAVQPSLAPLPQPEKPLQPAWLPDFLQQHEQALPSMGVAMPPDQAQFDPQSPGFNPGGLLQRVGQIIKIGRQVTGQWLTPEVVHDLARSNIPLESAAAVLQFIVANDGERQVVLQQSDIMAHNLVQAGKDALTNLGNAVGQGLQQQPLVQDFTQNNVPRFLIDIAPPGMAQGLGLAAAGGQDIATLATAGGSAFSDKTALYVPDWNGQILNAKTGQALTPLTPEWNQMVADTKLAQSAPHVGLSDNNTGAPHTVTDIRNDLAAAGYIPNADGTGPLTQSEVAAWRQYYDHKGGQNVQTQLQLQGAGFGMSLPVTGFFNPTNPDGSVNDTGQRWVAAAQDYQSYLQGLNSYIAEHPQDAVWMRDVPLAGALLSWVHGNDQVAAHIMDQQRQQVTQTTITGKAPPVIQQVGGAAEVALRTVMALATNAGAAFDAVPNSEIMGAKIQADPQWQELERRLYQQMTPDQRAAYDSSQERGLKQGFGMSLEMIKDPELQRQAKAIALKNLTQYGYYNPDNGPLGGSPKTLGGVAEALTYLDPNQSSRQATQDFLEEHPLVTDLANILLTWKLVPGKFGSTTRGVVGEPGVYATVAGRTGGVINPVIDEIWNAHNEARAVDQQKIGGILTAGTSHPHYNAVADFQPARTAAGALDDFYPTVQHTITGDKAALERVHMNLAKSGGTATLEDVPAKPVSFKNDANPYVRDIAQSYVKDRSLPAYGDHTPAEITPQEGRKISDFYEQAKDNPTDPAVQASYKAFADEVNAQYDAAVKAGMKFEPWEKPGQPYKSSADMMKDVRDNHHLYYFKTGDEGSNAIHGALDRATNDRFRAIHDLFGHAQTGWQFGKNGEFNAFLEHSKMFTDDAIPAMASETLAQNAYVNFAKVNEGKKLADRAFPVQKATVVPPELYGPVLARRGAAQGATAKALTVKAQLPWEFDRLRNAVADQPVQVLDKAGNPATDLAYNGPTLTKSKLKDLVSARLDDLNQKYPKMLTTRMTLPVRLNNLASGLAYNPRVAPLARNLLVQSFNGVVEHADPLMVDSFKRSVAQMVHDPVLARAWSNEMTLAYQAGPKGYAQAESLVHQLSEYVATHYKLDKDFQAVNLERTGDAAGFSVPTADGVKERSIFPTELGSHAHYIPDYDAAIQKGEVPQWLSSASWRGSEPVQNAWKKLDEAGHELVTRTTRALNTANYWLYRKWATYLSPPFQAKVATKTLWTTAVADVKAPRKVWQVMNKGLDESPLGQRLLNEIVPRGFKHDTAAYFGDRTPLEDSLRDGLQRRSRDDVTKIFRDVYGQPLKNLLGEDGHAQMGASLRHTIDETNGVVDRLRAAPVGGEAYVQAQADLPKLEQQLARAHNDLKDWRENRVSPANGGADTVKARLTEWLASPAGEHFKSAVGAQEGIQWSPEIEHSYLTSATHHLSDLWYDQPNLRDAFIAGTTDGHKLYNIAKNNNELVDETGRSWVPTRGKAETVTPSVLKSGWAWADDKASQASYYALTKSKDFAFRNLAAQYYNELRPNVEAGIIDNDSAMAVAIYKARDMANDLYFDLSSSMLQIEKRLRFILPFATKRRLFWQQAAAVALKEPRIDMALSEVANHVEAMNRGENENNRDKISFTLPFGILGFPAGSTVDMHLYNQFWLGQHGDEIENYALLHTALNTAGITHPDPQAQFQSVFGYYPSARAPQDSLIPRFGDWWIWTSAAMQSQGVWPGGKKTLDQIYNAMPSDLVAQHQRLTNAILAQSYREGNNLSVDDAAHTAFLDLLMHSTAKIGLPGAPGITPAQQVMSQDEIKQYWNATSKQEIDALEAKYPGLTDELHMTRDPAQFKQWVLANAQSAIIQRDFNTQEGNFEASHKITDLITDKHAQEQLAQIKRVRDDAFAQLAQQFPVWGQFHGYGYLDKDGVWKSNDDVKRMLAQRGSPFELPPDQLASTSPTSGGVLQQAQRMYSNFTDANNIVPISKADHDQLLGVMATYSSIDDAIAKFEALPDDPNTDKILTDLRVQRSHFINEFQNILDAYWPHGAKTTMEAAREQYYKDVYTPWVAAQKPIFDQLDPKNYPFLTKTQKGQLEDQLTAIKDNFNKPYTLPQFPGATFPAPEEVNWINKTPDKQAVAIAKWQVINGYAPQYLTEWQRQLLSDPKQIAQAIGGWDKGTYNLYLATLKDSLASSGGGYRSFSSGYRYNGQYYRTTNDAWRAQARASGREPNVFGTQIPVTDATPAGRAPANVFA